MESLDNQYDAAQLNKFKKDELIELIFQLQKEKNIIKLESEAMKSITDRVTELERSHYLYMQYGRRESVEITGIPDEIEQNNLEDEVLNIYTEAKVEIFGRRLEKSDIAACHRVGKKGVTVVRFVNRKFANEGLYCGKNLKNTRIYGNSPVYINNSFCREFKKYGYIIRKLKNNKQIDSYKIKHGVYNIKKDPYGPLVEIAHLNDFEKCGIDVQAFL